MGNSRSNMISLLVKGMDGREVNIEVNKEDPFGTLFDEIRRLKLFPYERDGYSQLWIRFNGIKLSEEEDSFFIMNDIGLTEGARVEVLLELPSLGGNPPESYSRKFNIIRNNVQGQQQPKSTNQMPPPKEPEKRKT